MCLKVWIGMEGLRLGISNGKRKVFVGGNGGEGGEKMVVGDEEQE